VTHECYAVFKGRSTLLLGRGPLDPADEHDLVVDLKEKDAIILPVGVARCSVESSPDYEYVGLYPTVWIFGYSVPNPLANHEYREVLTGTTISAGPRDRNCPKGRKCSSCSDTWLRSNLRRWWTFRGYMEASIASQG
jgi:hypothetical protein